MNNSHARVQVNVHCLGRLDKPIPVVRLLLGFMLRLFNLARYPDPFLELGQEPALDG